MFSLDYSDIPQQQTFLPNYHSPPFTSFSHERSPFQFHHQTLNLPHQMGIFLPQTLDQDPSGFAAPNNDGFMIPKSRSVYEFNCNQGSLGLLSPVKKDRHSKISTAHGVRDRRVRLSIAIAREFFDLQDMLGFDKASKTIGWLLAKSKGAIQELALAKQGSGLDLSRSNSSASFDHHEDAFANSSTTDTMVMRKRSVSSTPSRRRSHKSAPKEENVKFSVENQANFIAARENRARARARARARTREKLSTMPKSIEFDDLGLNTGGRTSCSSHLLTDSKDQNISRSLHGQNVMIRGRHSLPLISCPGYLQSLLCAPTDASVRLNHLPNVVTASNNSESPMCSSFSGWNILSFPSEMEMTSSKPYWQTLDNQVEQQYNQHQGELR